MRQAMKAETPKYSCPEAARLVENCNARRANVLPHTRPLNSTRFLTEIIRRTLSLTDARRTTSSIHPVRTRQARRARGFVRDRAARSQHASRTRPRDDARRRAIGGFAHRERRAACGYVREGENAAAKQRIGVRAAAFVPDGASSFIIDSGSTTQALTRALRTGTGSAFIRTTGASRCCSGGAMAIA